MAISTHLFNSDDNISSNCNNCYQHEVSESSPIPLLPACYLARPSTLSLFSYVRSLLPTVEHSIMLNDLFFMVVDRALRNNCFI